ncbi:MAG: heavy metal translocating P-type ATPase [Gemmatimonadetes bacterium]|nr:heavy metal translocating P-type ATPase [Gemmatimonadota bacterium]
MNTATDARGAPAPGVVPCAHCGLEVPAGLIEDGAERQFCCSGCRTAYAILHEHGLGQYYAFGDKRDAPVRPTGKKYEEFDHEAFHTLYVKPLKGGLLTTELYLEGVHCSSCVWLVERVPLLLSGVVRAELDVRRARAHLEWDPSAVTLSAIAQQLDVLGYPPHPYRGVAAEEMCRKEDRAMLMRIGISGALAGNIMLLALAQYAGWFTGIEAEYERYFRIISLALTAPSLFGPGWLFFQGALASVRTRRLHIDLPIAIALLAGFTRGAINTVNGSGPIYFDAVGTLVFLLLSGRFLQNRGQRAAADAAELLGSLAPTAARVVDEQGERRVPVEALLPSMVMSVRAGETFAADGDVTDGKSAADCSLLTGEPRPEPVDIGTRVYAGTVNLTGPLRVKITQAGEMSRLGALLRRMEESAKRRAPVVQLANRIAGWFVAAVLVLAVVTYLYGLRQDPARALDNAIALLVVTCPCALGLATPLAITVGIGRAAKTGILIKGGDAIEALNHPGLLLLDKTGTITEGRLRLVRWEGSDAAKPLVAALERGSSHPIAVAVQQAWPVVEVLEAQDISQTAGGGIEGVVNGHRVVVGAPTFVARQTGAEDHAPEVRIDAFAEEGLTPVWVAVDGQIVAHAGFGDPLRADARASIDRLRALGWRVAILSGDHPAVVRATAQRLGIELSDAHGGASPEEKLRRVEEARTRGTVVMVGDGVNDAAAIAAATVGVGVHGGAEASMSAADVYLSRPGLGPLVELVHGARRTMLVIRNNILFSIAYNTLGASLALMGILDPLIAAVLMPMSSLSVVYSSWRGRTFEVPVVRQRTAEPSSGIPPLEPSA